MKKILSLFFILSILSYGNTKHINYIMSRNSKLSREEATKIYEILDSNSKKYNVDLNLILAVASVESGFRQNATSQAGAYGIMQIMPITAEHYSIDRKNIEDNSEAGVKHLRDSINEFGFNDYAIASYNAGISKVKNSNYRNIPETRYYVAKVSQEMEKLGSAIELKNKETMLDRYKKGELEIKELKKQIAMLKTENEELRENNSNVNLNNNIVDNTDNEIIEKEVQEEQPQRSLGFKMGGLGFNLNN